MIVRWPGHVNPDLSSDALFSQVDLFASFASLTSARVPAAGAPDSFNSLPALLGRSQTGRRYVVEHAGALALIEGNWKFIAPSSGPKLNRNTNTELGNDPRPQLYDMTADRGEKNNVADSHPDVVARMAAELDRIRAAARTRP